MKKFLPLLILFCCAASLPPEQMAAFFGDPVGSSACDTPGSFSYVTTLKAHGDGSGATATTAGADTTGVTLAVIDVASDGATISVDSFPANTWHAGTATTHGGVTEQKFYCLLPETDAGSATFSATGDNVVVHVQLFSSTGIPSFVGESAGGGSSSDVDFKPGSIAAHGTQLFLTGLASVRGLGFGGIDSDFSAPVSQSGATVSGAVSYKSSSGTENPTWNVDETGFAGAATMMLFDPGCGSSGGAAWTLIDHAGVKASGNIDTLTTPSFNTVGANLVVFIVAWSGGSPTVGSSSPSDTVQAATTYTANNPKVQCFYVINPTASSSYTVTTAAGGNNIDSIHAYAFHKGSGTPSFDQEALGNRTGNWQGTTLDSGGAITPSTASDLIFTAVSWDVPTTTSATADSSFTASPEGTFYNSYGLNSAYKIKSDNTAENPGWKGTPTSNADADASAWYFQ